MDLLIYALGSAIGGLLALGFGWLLVDRVIWPWAKMGARDSGREHGSPSLGEVLSKFVLAGSAR